MASCRKLSMIDDRVTTQCISNLVITLQVMNIGYCEIIPALTRRFGGVKGFFVVALILYYNKIPRIAGM
jgi:hypothetical protein